MSGGYYCAFSTAYQAQPDSSDQYLSLCFLVSASDFLPVSLRVSGVCGFTAFVAPPSPFSTAPVDGSPFGSGTPDHSRSDFEPTLRLIYIWVGLFPCFYPKFGKRHSTVSSTLPEK